MDKKLISDYMKKIQPCFEKEYNSICGKLSLKNKEKLLKYSVCMYQKWYNSAVIEDTALSWSNVYEGLCIEKDIEDTIIPLVIPEAFDSKAGFCMKINSYSKKSNPITEDLFAVLDYFGNQIVINDDMSVEDGVFCEIAPKISCPDRFYIAYLLEISCALGIVEEVTSIYATVLVKNDDIEKLRSESGEYKLKVIMDAGFEVAAYKLCDVLGCDSLAINGDRIRGWIAEPTPVDDMFKEIFEIFDINIEEIWSMDIKETDDMERYLLSTTYALGVLIDRWILTPFCYYFGIIQPLYTMPYKFKDEAMYILEALEADMGELESAVFSPCTKYFLTRFGAEIMNSSYDESKRENLSSMPMEMVAALLGDRILEKYRSRRGIEVDVYHIKGRFTDEPSYWRVLEVNCDMYLEELHFTICKAFGLNPEVAHSFFMNKSLSPFVEYVSRNTNSKNNKKTYTAILADFNMEIGEKFVYKHMSDEFGFADNGGVLFLELEIIKKKTVNYQKFYPRTVRKSKFAKEIEEF